MVSKRTGLIEKPVCAPLHTTTCMEIQQQPYPISYERDMGEVGCRQSHPYLRVEGMLPERPSASICESYIQDIKRTPSDVRSVCQCDFCFLVLVVGVPIEVASQVFCLLSADSCYMFVHSLVLVDGDYLAESPLLGNFSSQESLVEEKC
ncbi:hypothetical protein Tco_1352860 [Tanacetum coccineum]